MRHILTLFGKSPYALLQEHMLTVAKCVEKLPALFLALKGDDTEMIQTLAKEIGELEHNADRTKNHIRNNLPSGLMLSMDRAVFLDILTTQDSIADSIEDISVLVMLRKLHFLEDLAPIFGQFLEKNISCFIEANAIIDELHELMESSFGGAEARRVQLMCDNVAFQEHEADLIQRNLLKTLYLKENELSYASFFQWQKVFSSVGAIANLSEKLANFVRMTLDIK